MALIYANSNIAAGNQILDATSQQTLSIWGMTFVENSRFVLVLARRSDGEMVWKKVDPLMLTPVAYDMLYAPTVAGISATDRGATAQGQFLVADADYLYYVKGNVVYRRNYMTGDAAGSLILRDANGTSLNGATINAIVLTTAGLSVVSKTDGKVYFFETPVLTWNGVALSATRQISDSDFVNSNIVGAFAQPNSGDLVVLLSGSASVAIKYDSAITVRKGVTPVLDSDARVPFNISKVVAAQFRGSILHILASDNTQAGTGIYIYRLADGSTNVVSKEQTFLSFDLDRVKVNSGAVVKVTFRVRDGYGEKFRPTDYTRFTTMKVGDQYDKNDGAFALGLTGPFRDAMGFPHNSSIDVPFDSNGEAICYWQVPEEIPAEIFYHRIHAQYPVN